MMTLETPQQWAERVKAARAEGLHPVSDAMENRLSAWRRDPSVAVFPLVATFELTGELDRARLVRAWAQVTERHSILRSQPAVGSDDGIWLRRIGPAPMHSGDIGTRDAVFDPFSSPLVDVSCVGSGTRHTLHMEISHLLIDAYSMNLVIKELAAAYNGETLTPVPDADFSDWSMRQRAYLRGAQASTDLAWWEAAAAKADMGTSRMAELPPGVASEVRDMLSAEAVAAIKDIGRRRRASAFAVLLGTFARVLRSADQHADLLFTTSFAHRRTRADYGLVGCLTSRTLIPLGAEDARPAAVQPSVWDALEHSRVPYAWIRRAALSARPALLDADPTIPYFAVTESWRHQLTLHGIEVAPKTRTETRRAETLELWVEQSAGGFELVLKGPYHESVLHELLMDFERRCELEEP